MIGPDGSPALPSLQVADTAAPLHPAGLHTVGPGHLDAGASAVVA